MFLSEQFKNRMGKAFIFLWTEASLFMVISNSLKGFPISILILKMHRDSGGLGNTCAERRTN